MPTYYTFIPNFDVTAEVVDAPDSRHARTAFLDFLTRNRYINYSNRGITRQQIKTARVETGSTQPYVAIQYQTGNVEYVKPSEAEQGDVGSLTPPIEQEQIVEPLEQEKVVPQEQPVQEQPKQPTNPFATSPLMQLSKKEGSNLWEGMRKRVGGL